MFSRSWLRGLFYAASLMVSPSVVLSSTPALADEPLKVGYIGALTGPAAVYGVACKRGIEMALDDLGPKSHLEIFYEDDQFDKKTSVLLMQRLVTQTDAQFIFTVGSSVSNATAPIAEERKIPYLTWASDPKVSRGRSFVIRTAPSGQSDGATAAKILKDRGETPTALFISHNEYAESVGEGVRNNLAGLIVADEELELDQRDFRTAIVRVRAKQPKSLFVCLLPGQVGLFAKQVRSLGMKTPLLGCETMNDANEFAVAPKALTGASFVSTTVDPEFAQRVLKRYGDVSVVSGTAIQYDVVMRLNAALDANPSLRGRALVEALLNGGTKSGMAGKTEFHKNEGPGDPSAINQYLDVERKENTLTLDFFRR